MSATSLQPSPDSIDPFEDPAGSEVSNADAALTLTVDRNATLTLGTDALIILDEGLKYRRKPRNFCGLLPQLSKTTRAVPFYNILWAELVHFEVTIHYARPSGKNACRVAYVNYAVLDKTYFAQAQAWVDALLSRAYPAGVRRRPRMKVMINPKGGQGYAQKLWRREIEKIFAAAHCEADVERTAYRGHAANMAEQLDVNAFDVVACASGDGLPHEVFNGLARRRDATGALRKIAVVQLPCGTGNAMSLNLNGTDSPSLAALAIVKGVRTPMDLVAITQGDQKYYSFLSQSVGIIAESDLGTERLRWMGPMRFTWGILVRLLGKTVYPAELSVAIEEDDKRVIKERYRKARTAHEQSGPQHSSPAIPRLSNDSLPPLRYGTISSPLPETFTHQSLPTLGNFYTGNMAYMAPSTPFFPVALPADGCQDMVIVDGLLPRLTALRMLTTVESGANIDFPEVSYRKVTAYRITPRVVEKRDVSKGWRAKFGRWLGGQGGHKDGFIAVDGERVPFEAFQAEVVPGLGTVLSKRGGVYEFEGPPGTP
ncbi:hypothetical protein B0A48_07847 [Cryoendolithus antarcticus]|uniref:DAGKc domain-containing protein n=1 Tax=Cryoendolithus antarcticus TaxID=1507870 RepID=A0A1V8T0H4_9PEZI|nr:hypothetical protein B0A48_07847 [Cryoendolithus antarcticus]